MKKLYHKVKGCSLTKSTLFNYTFAGTPVQPPFHCPNGFRFIFIAGISEVRPPDEEVNSLSNPDNHLPPSLNPDSPPQQHSQPRNLSQSHQNDARLFISSIYLDEAGVLKVEQQMRIGHQWQARVDTQNIWRIVLPDESEFITNARLLLEQDNINST